MILSTPNTSGNSAASIRNGKVPRVVIIGNGMVCMHFLRKCIQYNLNKEFKLLVIGEEVQPAYDRIHLTDLFQLKDEKELWLEDFDWYATHQIALVTREQVVHINKDKNIIGTSSGREIEYNYLIFATGAYPFVPPVRGKKHEGVFTYRNISDLISIKNYSQNCSKIMVIGGGFLGIEIAKTMLDLGKDVTIVCNANNLMARQLSDEPAEILKNLILAEGVHILFKKRITHIRRNGSLVAKFSDGSTLPSDVIIFTAGIRPRDELAKLAALDCHIEGGIKVNDNLETSSSNIFAMGDCVVHNNTRYGLASPGYQMADVIISQLRGKKAKFQGADQSTTLKFFGIELAMYGDFLSDSTHLIWKTETQYRRLVTEKGKLIGVLSIGPWKELGEIQAYINTKTTLKPKEIKNFQSMGSLQLGKDKSVQNWAANAVVCSCRGVTKGEICSLIEKGVCDFKDISSQTSASTVCGTCKPLIEELIDPSSTAVPEKASWKLLAFLSGFSLVFSILYFLLPELPFSESVQTELFKLEAYWKETEWKQISGFSLLGTILVSLFMSLRKRLQWFKKFKFQILRAIHALLALIAIAVFALHSGLRFGTGLNMFLNVLFVLSCVAGAFSGLSVAFESYKTSPFSKSLKGSVVLVHILGTWMFPAMLVFHILTSYYY